MHGAHFLERIGLLSLLIATRLRQKASDRELTSLIKVQATVAVEY